MDHIGNLDPRNSRTADRVELGRATRKEVPRSTLGEWSPPADRPDVVAVLEAQNAQRLPDLVPVRYGRMVHSPFSYLRGSPVVMALDLAASPSTGIRTQLCGDAHLLNFGAYGTPERNLVFDLNDFDETLPGPFEWDVQRLVTSVLVAARTVGMGEKVGRDGARAAARAYRQHVRDLGDAGVLDIWYQRFDAAETFRDAFARLPGEGMLDKALDKARHRTSAQALRKLTEVVDGRLQFRHEPPLLEPLPAEVHAQFVEGLERAVANMPAEFHLLARRYRVVCTARKVVGVGSVGTRCMVAAAVGRDLDDVLVLQVKEAQQSVLAPYAGATTWSSEGERVVVGQRLMQAASDPFLSWADTLDGTASYYMRQLRDMKGSANLDTMPPAALAPYAEVCGRVLARAHARAVPPSTIAGYVGGGETFDEAMERFAVAYADQTEVDHARLVEAVRDGEVLAVEGV